MDTQREEINVKFAKKMKQEIKKIMELIIKEELSKNNASLNSATYKDQRVLINNLFCKEKYDYSKGTVLLRLAVIDSLYSTNAAYSYFSFDDMADNILSIGDETTAADYFYGIAKGGVDERNLFGKKYGIRKNLAEGSQQMSLMTKYAYYALLQDKEKYPLGFPIYDSLVKEAYPKVCNMIGVPSKKTVKLPPMGTPSIEKFIEALKQVRSKLFDNEELFHEYQQFDIQDAYLWRMGKFEEGNLSLLLSKKEYEDFIIKIGLNACNESFDRFNETMVLNYLHQRELGCLTEQQINSLQIKKKRHTFKNVEKITYSFNFNKAVALELEKYDTSPFSNNYITDLYNHWRTVNHKNTQGTNE